MGKGRLEAFSDGVFAIIITIMVLEMKVPHGETLDAVKPLLPVFLSYILSFVYVGIYWTNHHHMLHACTRVSGAVLWANLHLLFWLSLFPFVTGWMGENHFAPLPSAFYGLALLMAACAYLILQQVIIAAQGPQSILKTAVGADWKGKLSPLLYLSRDRLDFLRLLGRTGALCRGGLDMADSGPPHRAGVATSGTRVGAADERTTEPHDRLVPRQAGIRAIFRRHSRSVTADNLWTIPRR